MSSEYENYGSDDVDPNDYVENPAPDNLEAALRYGVLAVGLAAALLYFGFTNPESAFGGINQTFLDTYKMSLLLASFSALYVLYSVRSEEDAEKRARLTQPVQLLLFGVAAWVPLLYLVEKVGSGYWYSSVWYVVLTRIVAAAGAAMLALRRRDDLLQNHIGTFCLYYLLFHVLIMDGMVWCFSYVT